MCKCYYIHLLVTCYNHNTGKRAKLNDIRECCYLQNLIRKLKMHNSDGLCFYYGMRYSMEPVIRIIQTAQGDEVKWRDLGSLESVSYTHLRAHETS